MSEPLKVDKLTADLMGARRSAELVLQASDGEERVRTGGTRTGRPDLGHAMTRNDPPDEEYEMVFPTVVLLVAVAVIALGAAAELTQAVRVRREPTGAPQAVQAVLDELDPRPFLVWLGTAALAVLAPGLLAGTNLAPGELGLAVVVLGLAGERGQYLARLAGTQGGRVAGGAVLGALTVLGGVVVGAS